MKLVSLFFITFTTVFTNHLTIMKKTITMLIACFCAALASAQGLTGSWTGKLKAGMSELTLVFNIGNAPDGKLSCTMDSPGQGAKEIPATIETEGETKLKISVSAIGMTYTGELVNDELCGTFRQQTFSAPMNLKRGKAEMNRPQTPVQPYPYPTEEVTFNNMADGATLSGTLTLPANSSAAVNGKVPVVVMVSGSGLQNRDEELFGHKPFLVLADMLARKGIATLRYDDRGTGQSKGDVVNATTENFMKDALAAVDFLRNDARFSRVGVLGHSEGGSIAFMLGAQGKVDFIVSMAGPALRGDSVLIEQNRMLLTSSGMPAKVTDDYCSALSAVFDLIRSGNTDKTPDTAVTDILTETNVSIPGAMQKNLVSIIEKLNPWMKYFIAYDPQADITTVNCPVMAVNGSLDTQVKASSNLEAIRRYLRRNRNKIVKEYVGLNHLFQHCTTGTVPEYAKIEETMSPEVMTDIAAWILSVCGK